MQKGRGSRVSSIPNLRDVMRSQTATEPLYALPLLEAKPFPSSIIRRTTGWVTKPCSHVSSEHQVGDVTSGKDETNRTNTFFIDCKKRGDNVATSRG